MANTGASTALAMEFFHPVAVINQGTSGGHDPDLHTFDIVLGKQSTNYSAWKSVASAKGAGVDYKALEQNGVYAYDKEEKTFVKEVYHAGDEKLLAAANAVKDSYTKGKIVEGTISSCDAWNNQIDRMLFLHEFYGSSCEEMETDGAALTVLYGELRVRQRLLGHGVPPRSARPMTCRSWASASSPIRASTARTSIPPPAPPARPMCWRS